MYLADLARIEHCALGTSRVGKTWLESLVLPAQLHRLLTNGWPERDCRFGHDILFSIDSIFADHATSKLLEHYFLVVGSASDGDWLVVDFSTDDCLAGLLPHDQWNPHEVDAGDPRAHVWAERTLEEFLAEHLEATKVIYREHEDAKAAAEKRAPLHFIAKHTFGTDCTLESVPIPEGYDAKTSGHSPCTVWLSPQKRGGGMVVDLSSLRHERVQQAREGRGFRDLPVGEKIWHLAMPDPHSNSLDSFMALLILHDTAVAVHASNLYWKVDDLQAFLSNVRLR